MSRRARRFGWTSGPRRKIMEATTELWKKCSFTKQFALVLRFADLFGSQLAEHELESLGLQRRPGCWGEPFASPLPDFWPKRQCCSCRGFEAGIDEHHITRLIARSHL